MPRPTDSRSTIVASVAAAMAAIVALVQLRSGVLQLLDTASYVSGAQAFRDGRPFTTTIAPSFSNFTAIEFLERGGRLPFVDFPVGYVSLAGVLGLVAGARNALSLVVVVAVAVFAAIVVLGPAPARYRPTTMVRATFALLVICLPTFRLVIQGALSEPLFCAVLVAFAVALARYRSTGEGFRWALVLGASLGLLRFLGGPLAVLPAIEHFRRERNARRALMLAAAALVPTAANVLGAGAVGGGHTSHWHGLDRSDLRLVARSIAGLFDATAGDLARTLLMVGDVVPWWGYPIALAWVVGVAIATLQYVGLMRRRLLPEALEICLTIAGLLTVTLLAGIAAFDALATPDNRIMLPAGVITLCGIVWSIDAGGRRGWLAVGVVALWALPAVRPWNAAELFIQPDRMVAAEAFADLGAEVIITNDADGMNFLTGVSAAYLPPMRMSLTDEPVDREAIFAALPCALREHNGVVVVFANAMFGVLGQAELDALVADGLLIVEALPEGLIYRPSGILSCT